MSLEVLEAVNNAIARKAAREGLSPYAPFSADEVTTPFTFPNIGTLKPLAGRGWAQAGSLTRPDTAWTGSRR
jgi:hypothetical protein